MQFRKPFLVRDHLFCESRNSEARVFTFYYTFFFLTRKRTINILGLLLFSTLVVTVKTLQNHKSLAIKAQLFLRYMLCNPLLTCTYVVKYYTIHTGPHDRISSTLKLGLSNLRNPKVTGNDSKPSRHVQIATQNSRLPSNWGIVQGPTEERSWAQFHPLWRKSRKPSGQTMWRSTVFPSLQWLLFLVSKTLWTSDSVLRQSNWGGFFSP